MSERSTGRPLAALCVAMALCGSSAVFAAACSSSTGIGENAATPDGGATSHDAAFDAPDAHVKVDADAALPAPPPLLFYNLQTAPFPNSGHPDVAVHIPPGFDATNRPGLIVFFHGFDNCVANVVGSVDTACTPDGGARSAMHLIDQLNTTRANAILVAVQLAFDESTGNPGQLTKPGDFRALIHELFSLHLNPLINRALDVPDFDRIIVGSHSGGYEATAAVVEYGQVPELREIDLYDSLYGYIQVFDGWMTSNISRFDAKQAKGLRWMDVYTSGGGTAANSRTMAASSATWLGDAGLSGSLLDDDTTDTLDAGAFAHPVLFKLTSLAHASVPTYYFQRFTQSSGFATIP